MWMAAEDAGQAIEEARSMMETTTRQYTEAVQDIKKSFNHIGEAVPKAKTKNPGLTDELIDILEWE